MDQKFTLITILVMLFGFIATKAIGGVISEYAKRLWFQKLEPMIASVIVKDRPLKLPITDDSAATLDELAPEIENLRLIAEKALLDRDYWHEEAMRLRIELSKRKAA